MALSVLSGVQAGVIFMVAVVSWVVEILGDSQWAELLDGMVALFVSLSDGRQSPGRRSGE